MKKSILVLGCLALTGCTSYPIYDIPNNAYQVISTRDTHRNIILLTIDGVRWQEFFHGTDAEINPGAAEAVVFKNLSKRLSASGMTMGDRNQGSEMTVSNPSLISLPAYQSILSGLTQNCFSNSCSRTPVETLPERLITQLKLEKDLVATLASWSTIALAAEQKEGNTIVNAGIVPLEDKMGDQELDSINKIQFNDGSSGGTRLDKTTINLALWYLKKHKPRFLYISLNDSDDFAHSNKYRKYIDSLHTYDEFIETLYKTLEDLGAYGQATTILITTDHGRGTQKRWTDHGSSTAEAKYIWFAAISPSLSKKISTQTVYQHIDIVPTIQSIMGIETKLCEQCGKPITELVSALEIQTKL